MSRDTFIYLRALGNAPFIGKSCLYVDIPDVCSFILDYGCSADANLAKPVDLDKKFTHGGRQVNPLEDADFMFISHAHMDHAGGLQRCDFQRPIYASKLTSMQFPRAQPVQYYEKCYVKPDAYFIATPAGHIPGACIFTFVCPKLKLVYTGDYELKESFLLQNCTFPEEAIGCDVFITETTFSQIVTRDEKYLQTQHFQTVSLCHAAQRAAIHPVSSTGQAQTLALQLNQFAKRLGQRGYELAAGQVKQIHMLYCQSQDINLNYGLYLRQTFQDYKQFNQKRTIVLSTPHKLNGGTTLDVMFEQMENPGSMLVLSGFCAPGSPQWRYYHGITQKCRRDNAKEFTTNKLQCEVLSFATHSDFVDLSRVLMLLKPRLVVGTHCAKLDSLDVVDKLISSLLPRSRFVILSQQAICIKQRFAASNGYDKHVFRTKLKIPVQLAIDKLLDAGIVMIRRINVNSEQQNEETDEFWQCGGLIIHGDVVSLCNGVASYKKAMEILEIDYMLAKSL